MEEVVGSIPISSTTASARVNHEGELTGRHKSGAAFRPDIDGLRAIAVLLVVGFHGDVPGLHAGFVGVDIFFVISGFLITRNLLNEEHGTRRVSLSRFWARRFRRLIPALSLVILTTLIACVLLLPVTYWSDVGHDSIWSAIYASNVNYQRLAQGYFAPDLNGRLLLHTWSLAVEEQFYFVWPLLFVGCIALSRRLRRAVPGALGVVFVGIALNSFLASRLWTNGGSPWAFYSVMSRAWEFAVAGLLALLLDRLPVPPAVLRSLAGWIGAGLLAIALTVIGASTPYPGTAAVLPVSATLLLLVAGSGSPSMLSRTLAAPPLQALGRLSYSWYLWHWPAILFAVALWRDAPLIRAVAALLSLVVAAGAYVLVERPVRFARSLTSRPSKTFALAAVAVLGTVGLSVGVADAGARRVASDPFLAQVTRAMSAPHEACGGKFVATKDCVFGDLLATGTVMLVGDSHGEHWIEAFDAAAKDLHLRLVVRTQVGCPFINVPSHDPPPGQTHPGCEEFRRDTYAKLLSQRPVAVVMSNRVDDSTSVLDATGTLASAPDRAGLWQRLTTELATALLGAGIHVGVILDGPSFPVAPNICALKRHSFRTCGYPTTSSARAGAVYRSSVVSVARALPELKTFDAMALLCPRSTCPGELARRVVYEDKSHLTPEFSAATSGAMARFLQRLTSS